MARIKKPSVEKKLQKTFRADREKKTTAKPEVEKGLIDEFIADNEVVNIYYPKIAAVLEDSNILTKADTMIVRRLCDSYHLYSKVTAEILNAPLLLETGRGGEASRSSFVKNPLMSTRKALNDEILAMEVQLGLTPSARAKLNINGNNKTEEQNEFIELVTRKKERTPLKRVK